MYIITNTLAHACCYVFTLLSYFELENLSETVESLDPLLRYVTTCTHYYVMCSSCYPGAFIVIITMHALVRIRV